MSPTMQKLIKRTALLAAVGVVLTQMLPSLADQLTPNPVVENAQSEPSPESTPEPSESPSATSSEVVEPVADVTYLPSETPTVKAKVIESASLFFRVPNSVKVDPRATSLRFNSIALGGAEEVLVCISSAKANLSLASRTGILVEGEGSRVLALAGSAGSVLAALTSGHGLTLQSPGRISGSVVTFGVAALNKPSVDAGLCGGAQITRSTAVTALGIDLNTVKTPVNLGKK